METNRKSKSTEGLRGRPSGRARLRPQATARFYLPLSWVATRVTITLAIAVLIATAISRTIALISAIIATIVIRIANGNNNSKY